ncbi:MAG: sensor histidine kinase [Thermoleophilia bacterium]
MRYIQIKWKLLVTYLAVVAVVLGVVVVVGRQLTISSYSGHIRNMGSMMGHNMSGGMQQDLDEAFRRALNISLIWAGGIAVVTAVVISFLIARHFTRPIHDMAAATERIAAGDYSQRVEVNPGDEIGDLAGSLNRMVVSLDDTERMKRELMGNIAHELRTPLTTISGYMEGLVDGVLPAEPATYELIKGEADRLSRLVDDLQRLSRAESGREILDVVPLEVAPLVERVTARLRPQFDLKRVALDTGIDPAASVLADADKLEQVMINLLDNALLYTDPGGSVTISATPRGASTEISVRDTGRGIPSQDLPYVFERFYRSDKSRSRDSGGSGIGLTIVKSYVEALGGAITIDSAEGEGTAMLVSLPAAESKETSS